MSQTNQPTVACIMLVNGREAMVRRAIKSFREQTYENKSLLIFDTGDPYKGDTFGTHHVMFGSIDWTIGRLRNEVNALCQSSDVIMHFDSDDWSHPNRIAEQVALLQSSGRQCVGYRDMLFWDSTKAEIEVHPYIPHGTGVLGVVKSIGEACLYTNPDPRYCLGTSLCYWRSAWEARPFPDLPKKKGGPGEDVEWLREVNSLGVTNFGAVIELPPSVVPIEYDGYEPRMIASIHGANTQYYNPAEYVARERGTSWKRAAEWDSYCRDRMSL